MDIPVMSALFLHGGRLKAARVALAAALMASSAIPAVRAADATLDVAVKAAFLYNFAKFTEWPTLRLGAPLIVCVAGDDEIAAALVETVRGQTISGHALEVRRSQDDTAWRACHVLFIADAAFSGSAWRLYDITMLPVLTVSDAKGSARAGGMIELYVESGRMRFAINTDATDRSGLRLSSRLLGLARVVRDGQ
jgi:YfiR/HmsC-like